MIGYAFLDADCRLQYRTQEFIEVDRPMFWQENRAFIMHKWKFDTEDLVSMKRMFKSIREAFRIYKLDDTGALEFCKMINFDTKILKNAN